MGINFNFKMSEWIDILNFMYFNLKVCDKLKVCNILS